jgi:AGCS family alanine or glycine:cation symporter
MEQFASTVQDAADAMFMPWTVVLLLTAGAFLTVRLRFVQIVRFPDAVREMMGERQSGSLGALVPFQAFMTALAGSIGTGNIVGVTMAIVQGGPGALFWIWCYGFFAMAIKFAEAALGLHYRVADGDSVLSGPMYYLRDGLKQPWLAWVFALIGGIACLLTTPFTQPNSVAVVLNSQLARHSITSQTWQLGSTEIDLQRLIIGCVLAVLTWLVIVRGVQSIGRAAAKLSPLKVGLYLVGGVIVLVTHASALPETLALVFREAFSTQAATGTVAGIGIWQAIRYGLARGIYANEAGYGTAAVAYGTAKSTRPEQQGLNAVMEVFIISFVTSSISALTVLVTGVWRPEALGIARDAAKMLGPEAVPAAFNAAMPTVGGWMVTVSVFLFGYTTLIGWAYYGEQFLEYLFGRSIIMPYRWLFCALIPLGAVAQPDLVWAWGDLLNGLQIFPNVIGLIGLSGIAAKYARRNDDSYSKQRRR